MPPTDASILGMNILFIFRDAQLLFYCIKQRVCCFGLFQGEAGRLADRQSCV